MKNKKQASKNEIDINDIEQQEDKATLLTPVPILDGLEEIEHNLKYLTQTGEIKFSLEILDDATGFIFPGSITLILACPNVGKAVDLDTKILTPTGWVKNRDIKVGDYIIGQDGKPTRVTGVYPQGVTDTYKVMFTDGREIIASPEHLWAVESSRFRTRRILQTEEIVEYYKKDYLKGRLRVPQYSGNHGVDKDFIIPPYVLGVLLGDGCLTTKGVVYCKPSLEVFNKVKSYLPNREIVMLRSKNVSIKNSKDISDELNRLNLRVHSYNKFIPQEYLIGTSKKQREELLQGLLDTDGYQTKSYNEFSTTSKQLALGVQQLAWSLGYDCRLKSRMGKYKKDGEIKETRINYRVIISNKRHKSQALIKDVIPYKRLETQCITVDNKDKLFVLENYIVTHNSLIAQSEACSIAKQGEKVLFCSCEMSPGQLMSRELKKCMGVSNKQLLDGYKKNPNNVSKALNRFKEDEQFNYLNNILILDICDQHIDNLIKTFDNYKDYKYIIVDYVQSLKGTGDDERTQFKDISRKLKTYALRNNVSIIACGQIPKSNENENRTSREGVNFQKLKALGAGNWEQDADLAIKMVEELEGNQTYVLINLSKNRLGELKNVTYKYQKTPRLEFKLISKGY